MSKEDWKYVEDQLSLIFTDGVTLNCDGYLLKLQLERATTYTNIITFFINGWQKGKWILGDCEERRRFFRPVSRRIYRKNAFKGASKAELFRMNIDPNRKITAYFPYWTNFNSLRRHLIKHNQDISLVPKDVDALLDTIAAPTPGIKPAHDNPEEPPPCDEK